MDVITTNQLQKHYSVRGEVWDKLRRALSALGIIKRTAKGSRTFEQLKELPANVPAVYALYRQRYCTDFQSVTEGGDLDDLADELENWRDGMSGTNLEYTDLYSQVEEAADYLGSARDEIQYIEWPEWIAEHEFIAAPAWDTILQPTRSGLGRQRRLDNVIAELDAAISELDDIKEAWDDLAEHFQHLKPNATPAGQPFQQWLDEAEETWGMVDEIRDILDNSKSELEGVEIPVPF